MENLKIVDFEKYCATCKYRLNAESDSPCWECLDIPARESSKKPEKWEPKFIRKENSHDKT